MAASVSFNLGILNGGMHSNTGSGVAFEIEISECVAVSSPMPPKRVRQRLEETAGSKSPASLEEIEFKLKEADSRRQQFHEWLANKARARPRSSILQQSEQSESLALRLEAKLSAAEHKRAELLAHEQTRLAKLHELRVAAKTEAQLRAEREREELGSKVEFRVQQAEINRLALLEAERQRIAAVRERVALFVQQRNSREGKDRARIETLRATICQKIAAAGEKRAGLLEAEKSRAQACVLQARRVAKAVVRERELETRKKREDLEARLQRAKRQRAEYLLKRGGCRGSYHTFGQKLHKEGERLCRKLTRCWRQFRGSRRTTHALAKEYAACAITQDLVVSLPFEQLASRITSPATLQCVKPLLARIESRLILSCAGKSTVDNVEHLLKYLSPQHRSKVSTEGFPGFQSSLTGKEPGPIRGTGSARQMGRFLVGGGLSKPGEEKTAKNVDDRQPQRFPARVFLCAYMILGQPDAVFSGKGGREIALAEAAAKLLPEFEALLAIILDGPTSTLRNASSPSEEGLENSGRNLPLVQENERNPFNFIASQRPFSTQLAAFDAAWCAYLYQFVAWKVKDAKALEGDLTRMACQLEISMLQKCGAGSGLSHDSQAIRKQVLDDQMLLHDRISRLTGTSGAARMDQALAEVRSRFREAKENGAPLLSPSSTPVTSRIRIASPTSPYPFLGSPGRDFTAEWSSNGSKSGVVRSLFDSHSQGNGMWQKEIERKRMRKASYRLRTPALTTLCSSNEKIVNDMLHADNGELLDLTGFCSHDRNNVPSITMSKLHSRIRSTIESAFWDGVMDGLMQSPPEFERVVVLVAEVRKELEDVIPDKWKQDLKDNMDLEILSNVLESGNNDFEYLRHLLDYASGLILKLGAPIRDGDTKAAHESLVADLSASTKGTAETQRNFANALVKGMRFIFDEIQVLKQDVNSTRLRVLAPFISGAAGVDYARNAFAGRFNLSVGPGFYATVTDVTSKLPLTAAWIAEVICSLEYQRAEVETAMVACKGASDLSHKDLVTSALPPLPAMRTGGRIGLSGITTNAYAEGISSEEGRPRPLAWNSNDTILRLGILHIVHRREAATEANVPETLALNVERLRNCQNEFQRIIVIATGLLLVRQGLAGKGLCGTDLDGVMHAGHEQLDRLLREPTSTLAQIGTLLAQISIGASNSAAIEEQTAYGDLLTRVLSKSLSFDDPVFARISAAVTASVRAVLLLGKGTQGLALARMALKRIGGSMLLDKITITSEMLERVSSVTCMVHGPWYSCMNAHKT